MKTPLESLIERYPEISPTDTSAKFSFGMVCSFAEEFANQKEEYSESGIEELDSLVKKYQNKEISFLTFVSDVWNVAYSIGKREDKSQLKEIISPEKFRVLAEWIDKIDL